VRSISVKRIPADPAVLSVYLATQLLTVPSVAFASGCPADACISRRAQVGPGVGIDRDWDQDLVNGLKWVSQQLTAAWEPLGICLSLCSQVSRAPSAKMA